MDEKGYYSGLVSQEFPIQFGSPTGFLINFNLTERKYNLQPTQIPKAVSRKSSVKQTMHNIQTGSKYEISFNRKSDNMKIVVVNIKP